MSNDNDYTVIWPVASPSAVRFAVEAIESGRTCGYAGNDAPLRTQWERESATAAGYRYGVAVTNGTHAIAVALAAQLLLRGRDWAAGRDLVGGPAFTWVPGTYAGARSGVFDVLDRGPRFQLFDANDVDWTVDAEAMVAWIEREHRRILGIVVPSLLDSFPDLAPIVEAADRHGLPFVSDGAQLGGARWGGRRKPPAQTLSTQWGKFEGGPTGDGGAVLVDDPCLAYVARRVTDCGNEPGGALDPLDGERFELPDGDEFALVGNYRLSGVLGAAALGARRDMAAWLPVLRDTRRAIGTEITAGEVLVVFRTPPIQRGETPTYGWGMSLTEAAERELGLTADHWRELFAAAGFANDEGGYRAGVRRPYPAAHRDPKLRRHVANPGDAFPQADAIGARGLMFHVGHLLDERTPERLQACVERTVADIAGVRRRFGI